METVVQVLRKIMNNYECMRWHGWDSNRIPQI